MLHHFLLAPTLLLLLTAQILSTGDCWKVPQKQRHKREWLVPSKKIIENVDYSNEPYVNRVVTIETKDTNILNALEMRSDLDEIMPLRYTLRGPGADQPPVGQFIVDEFKGFVRVIRPLDREERENYTLIGTAWFFNNTIAEDNIKVNIAVEDQNDNPPVFKKTERSSIYEGCAVGTFVTQVVAKDADKPNTLHSKIAYTLIKQEPNDGQLFFAVNKDNGTISVSNPSLDREEHSFYVLTVQAADMYGGAQGNSATASLTIDIMDVNDNIPTLEKDEFSASIDENVAPIEVLRIQALDDDEERTDNWLVVFEIVSGNEDGRFSIETDPRTNMGILYLNKPADFESASGMNLNLVVANKAYPGAPLGSGSGASGQSGASGASGQSGASGASGQSGASGASGQSGASGASGQSGASGASGQSGASGGSGQSGAFGGSGHPVFFEVKPGSSMSKQKSYLVKISVKNKPEPPKFRPKVKPISVSENTKGSIPKVIDIYPAVEEDTGKPAENVKYAKGYDPDNWISINPDTAEIKLNKLPDRESPYVVNGTYYAKIISITNEPHPQTSTGTIALQVEDLNDNCPKLLDNVQTVCSDTRVVNVTAEDRDSYPNGAPLKFNLIEEKTKGKWNLLTINDASASLLSQEDLWPGFYQVTMEISDMQGLACPDEQVLNLEVCTCSEGTLCGAKMAAATGRTKSATFGAPGISFLFLGFICLILVLMFLIKCECGSAGRGFTDIPFETKQYVISYSIEGIGEDRDVPLLRTPPKLNNGWDDNITKSQKPSGILEAMNCKTSMDEIHVQQSKQLHNGSKMVGVMQKSAFGGFYCDTDGADMENSACCQGEHGVVFDAFLKEYYTQKSRFLENYASPEEGLKKYNYEGEGSVAGSFDNCSFSESNDDPEFLNNLDFKFNTLAEVCGFRQTQSTSQADPQVIVSSVEATPTTTAFTTVSSEHMANTVQPSTTPTTTAFTAVSSDHMTNTVQPSPVEITVKSPLVQPTPSHGMVIQEPMYLRFEQPMQSNVLLPEGGLGQAFYIIDGTPEAGVFLTQGNGHAHLGSGQQGIIGDSVLCSQIGHVGSVVSGESGQGRVIRVGSLGSNHPMSPQPLYQVSSPEWSRPVHINQRVIDGADSIQMAQLNAQNDGQGTVTILESLVNGGSVLVGDAETLVRMPQIANGQVNSQRILSPPPALNFASGEGVVSRLLVAGPPIAEGHVNGGNLLVAEPGQYPVSMSAGTTSLVSLPHVSTGQVNNSQLLVSGPFSSVQSIVSGESGQSKPLVNGLTILEGPIQHPLAMSPGAHSRVGLPQIANRQLFGSSVSRVQSTTSKGHVANGHANV